MQTSTSSIVPGKLFSALCYLLTPTLSIAMEEILAACKG